MNEIELNRRAQRQLARVSEMDPLDFSPDKYDLSVFDPAFVDDNRKPMNYAADIEGNTPLYFNESVALLGDFSLFSSYTGAFQPSWLGQEVEHESFFKHVLAQGTKSKSKELDIDYSLDDQPSLKFIIGGLALQQNERAVTAADLVINLTGLGHEQTVRFKYMWLREQAKARREINVARGLSDIIFQENAHAGFYHVNSELIMSRMRPADVKLAIFIFKHFWNPVGVKSDKHAIGFGETALTIIGDEEAIDAQIVNPIEQLYSRLLDLDEATFIRKAIGDCIDLARAERQKAKQSDKKLLLSR
jgi:hypothetical protein